MLVYTPIPQCLRDDRIKCALIIYEVLEEFKSLKKSMQHCSDSCDDAVQLTKYIKVVTKEVKELTKSNQALKEENRRLAQRADELEQYSRANNLEIKAFQLTQTLMRLF